MKRLLALSVVLVAVHLAECCTSPNPEKVPLGLEKSIVLNPFRSCSKRYTADVGHRIRVHCAIFKVGSGSCAGDRLEIDGNKFCGTRSFQVVSLSNILDITTIASSNSIGKITCSIYAWKDPCNCGRRKTNRIVGGTDATVHEFPYQAMLVNNDGDLQCGATIIDTNYVMTAAHCVVGKDKSLFKIRVGEHDTSAALETSYTQTLPIYDFIPHANYNPTTSENDIALIRTKITLNENVGVVCLPWTLANNQFPSDDVIAAGWGTLEFGGPLSPVLQKVDLKTKTNEACGSSYPSLTSSMICTYEEDKDTCQYDSGTSIYYSHPENSLLYAIGVVSGGVGCGGSNPSINTRVTSFLDWILTKTPGATFCRI